MQQSRIKIKIHALQVIRVKVSHNNVNVVIRVCICVKKLLQPLSL